MFHASLDAGMCSCGDSSTRNATSTTGGIWPLHGSPSTNMPSSSHLSQPVAFLSFGTTALWIASAAALKSSLIALCFHARNSLLSRRSCVSSSLGCSPCIAANCLLAAATATFTSSCMSSIAFRFHSVSSAICLA